MIENAPAVNLDEGLRQRILGAACKLCSLINYRSAGTVEFLVDKHNNFYFMEVNPRVQVEHTVTEEVTGLNIVETQIRLAEGYTFEDLNLKQENIKTRGYAIQARITTENPAKQFQPDTGVIQYFQSATGRGIRLDGAGYQGYEVTPHYDSLLVKLTARDLTWEDTMNKLNRALNEFKVDGLQTNIPFLLNVLHNPIYRAGKATTFFLQENPKTMETNTKEIPESRVLHYLANLAVNGHPSDLGTNGAMPAKTDPVAPTVESKPLHGFRDILKKDGPKAFAAAVRAHKGLLLTDTTWRDGRSRHRRAAPPAVLAGVLGRRHLRRVDAFPARVSLGPSPAHARAGAQRALPDAAARRERGGLQRLRRQRELQVLRDGGEERNGRLPRLRLPQLHREHASRHRLRGRRRRRDRGLGLLHGRLLQP